MTDLLNFIGNNFLHILPLLLAAAFAIAIVVERSVALFVRYPMHNFDKFFERISDLVMSGKIADAISVCDAQGSKPAAEVVKQTLLRAHQPEPLIEHGLEIAVGKANQSITQRTQFLSSIANVATLLGLFGTIAGLVFSFKAVGAADPTQKSILLAEGIATAMNATMMGLGVAIPCMVAFSILVNRSNKMVADIDQAAVQTLDVLKQRFYSAEIQAVEMPSKKRTLNK